MIAFDTETSGLDLYHGSRPFFVSTCDHEGNQHHWEWDVDPITREVNVPRHHLLEIRHHLFDSNRLGDVDGKGRGDGGLVGHNLKFDFSAMYSVGFWNLHDVDDAWSRSNDTLLASHLLHSAMKHDLTSLAAAYKNIHLEPLEMNLQKAVEKARRLCRSHLKTWRIAAKGMPELPSATEKSWRNDYWLPRALCRWAERERKRWIKDVVPTLDAGTRILRRINLPWWWEYSFSSHPWHSALKEYANADTSTAVMLWHVFREMLERRGLWRIYQARRKVLPISYHMENRGISVSKRRLAALMDRAKKESTEAGQKCVEIAKERSYDLVLPKSSNNQSLTTFVFGHLQLPVVSRSEKTGNPSLDDKCLEHYVTTGEPDTDAFRFVTHLRKKRARDTSQSYLAQYQRYWVPHRSRDPEWFVLHPNVKPTGTNTLRFSMSNPSTQNISKKKEFSLRECFGPAPGREWWSLDFENIELRIPAYESGEEAMIELFERPDDPPYYGSQHLLYFDILYPEIFSKLGKLVKEPEHYKDTLYQWTKNGNFAIQYGAQEATADAAYHYPGAYRILKSRFKKLDALNDRYVRMARKYGYVETLPDRTVDPKRGYPIVCTRTEMGVMPTVPLNYHVQSTAMWCTQKAMERCASYLRELTDRDRRGYYMVLQVHDEIVFDFPRGGKANLGKINRIKHLMEESGRDIGVPLRVSVTYNPVSWAAGKDL